MITQEEAKDFIRRYREVVLDTPAGEVHVCGSKDVYEELIGQGKLAFSPNELIHLQWEKKLTASFNFEGALELAAAAAALAQGREDLVSGSDGTLPSWYRDPTKTERDGSAKTIGFYRPKDQPKTGEKEIRSRSKKT